jgi:hypothetical protein
MKREQEEMSLYFDAVRVATAKSSEASWSFRFKRQSPNSSLAYVEAKKVLDGSGHRESILTQWYDPKSKPSKACATRYGTVVRQLKEHFPSVSWVLATTPKMYRPRHEITKENGYAS